MVCPRTWATLSQWHWTDLGHPRSSTGRCRRSVWTDYRVRGLQGRRSEEVEEERGEQGGRARKGEGRGGGRAQTDQRGERKEESEREGGAHLRARRERGRGRREKGRGRRPNGRMQCTGIVEGEQIGSEHCSGTTRPLGSSAPATTCP
eukprot:2290430-Rhodomonas_salina.1